MFKPALADWSDLDRLELLDLDNPACFDGARDLIERETERLVNTFRGGFIAKNYPDLHGIGVDPKWDQWAYEALLKTGCSPSCHNASSA